MVRPMMSFNPSFLMKYYGLSLKDTALQFGLVSAGMGMGRKSQQDLK